MSNYTILTGATGLVGRYLMRDLLRQGQNLAVLVRPSRKQDPRQRVESILQMWEQELGVELPRPVVLAGDVAQAGLGLDKADRRWAADHCETMLHNAATLTFHAQSREGEPWRTNLEGTRHTLQLCRQLNIPHMHYVSTAYVCGRREGTVYEKDLDVGQSFRNDYEHAKFLAEKLVRQADFFDTCTVYRPVVIAGDSKTGYTNTYHGLYLYLRLMSTLMQYHEADKDGVKRIQTRLNLDGDELRNIVPIDWVASVMLRLFNTPEAHGGTYHLSPRRPLTPREMLEAAGKYFNSQGVEYCGQGSAPPDDMNDVERTVFDSTSIYSSYDTTDPVFDATNVRKFAADLPCPSIDEAMIHLYLKYGEEDRWGKRREAAADVEGWIDDILAESAEQDQQIRLDSAYDFSIGLDVTGPGGGPWRLSAVGEEGLSAVRGLDEKCKATLRIPSDVLLRMLHGRREFSLAAVESYLLLTDDSIEPEDVWEVLRRFFPQQVRPQALFDVSAANGVEVRRSQIPAIDSRRRSVASVRANPGKGTPTAYSLASSVFSYP